MLFEVASSEFNSLSLQDLLKARDQFHLHLMHKANVVGTAVGRYLIRKSDPYPTAAKQAAPAGPKPARTLENSEVREYSWPCVLVFVSRWLDENRFGTDGVAISDYVPKTIYMDDGQSVPVCVVLAPLVDSAPAPLAPDTASPPDNDLQGGIPILAKVQHVRHVATLGCLVTDGHTIYGLTNRHVCGKPGEKIRALVGGEEVMIGVSSEKQLGKVPFEALYDQWPGKNVYVHMDVGLVELGDARDWSASVVGIGPLGPIADLSTQNITLKLIDTPVRAHGCASGVLSGKIAALFYRFKSVAGFEYVSDFLIGSRDGTPLQTRPGDSGAIWVTEHGKPEYDRMPIALQWGGTVFSADATLFPFALATNLSNVFRELELDLFRGAGLASFEYWGPVGHYTIGGFACPLVSAPKLRTLMTANRESIGYRADGTIVTGFKPLADVPDTVWKNPPRGNSEKPTHYADMDFPDANNKTLFDHTPDAASLEPGTWRDYYHSIGWNQTSQRGLLPFRVWQIYKAMVGFVAAQDVPKFVTAAGVLAHYVGDACQPLHGTYLDDGDPFRNPDGTAAASMLGHGHGFGGGVHTAYESAMLTSKRVVFQQQLAAALPASHGMAVITTGCNAGFEVVKLMQRTRAQIPPMDIVNEYEAMQLANATNHSSNTLWTKFGADTVLVVADGCKTLAMLWDSAWSEGNGNAIPDSALTAIDRTDLETIFTDTSFLPSTILTNIDPLL